MTRIARIGQESQSIATCSARTLRNINGHLAGKSLRRASNLDGPNGSRKGWRMGDEKLVQVLVLGAGFGGLKFCEEFSHPRAYVTIVDRTNHHLFQPLLYQVATAGLS